MLYAAAWAIRPENPTHSRVSKVKALEYWDIRQNCLKRGEAVS
jgi:hypothetical protein